MDKKPTVLSVDATGSISPSLVPELALDCDLVRARAAILKEVQAVTFKKEGVETFRFKHLIVRPLDRITQ